MRTIIDLKSGKVPPWSSLQTAAYTLLDAPVDFESEGHVYYCTEVIARLHSVTEVLTAEGFIDTTWFSNYVRDRGSNIHLACHLDDIGDLDEDTVGEVEKPYLEAYRKFKCESGFVVEESEVPKANLKLMFAGTPDKIGHFTTGNLIKRAAVELHNDGKYKMIGYDNRQDVEIWKATLAVYFWKLNHLKGGK